jgi:hypothetical protein
MHPYNGNCKDRNWAGKQTRQGQGNRQGKDKRPVFLDKEPKKTGAHSARARGKNPKVLKIDMPLKSQLKDEIMAGTADKTSKRKQRNLQSLGCVKINNRLNSSV